MTSAAFELNEDVAPPISVSTAHVGCEVAWLIAGSLAHGCDNRKPQCHKATHGGGRRAQVQLLLCQ